MESVSTMIERGRIWGEKRKLSGGTLAAFRATFSIVDMPEQARCEVVALPYYRGETLVNVKYRAISSKQFRMKTGGELRFFNLENVLAGPCKQVYIVEGECDAMALYEAGIPIDQILSVPNGAPAETSANPDEQDRYRFVRAGLEEGLSRCQKFILCTDNDPPGRALRHDLVHLLHPARCWFVEWPERVKDANDLLIIGGPGELLDWVQGEAKEWPVNGLYLLRDLPEPRAITAWDPGFPEWESRLKFAPGMLSVFTGHPGHGKTLMAMQIWFNICREYQIKAAIGSFETHANPHHRRNIRQFYYGRHSDRLSDAERATADAWNNEHFVWMVHPERKPNFSWMLNMAEIAVIRHRVKVVQIDPWNKLEWDRPPEARETDWIRDRLNDMLAFAQDMDVHVMILAHPAKNNNPQNRKEPPYLDDISGSKHWDNIVDQGLSIHRPKVFEKGERKTDAALYHRKARYEEIGYPCKLELQYDLTTCRYRSIDYATPAELI
jgi:twinkle protein